MSQMLVQESVGVKTGQIVPGRTGVGLAIGRPHGHAVAILQHQQIRVGANLLFVVRPLEYSGGAGPVRRIGIGQIAVHHHHHRQIVQAGIDPDSREQLQIIVQLGGTGRNNQGVLRVLSQTREGLIRFIKAGCRRPRGQHTGDVAKEIRIAADQNNPGVG